MKRKRLIYVVIIVSFILLVTNMSNLDFSNLTTGSFLGIISNLLLIIAMFVTLNDIKRKKTD
jgi:hypothetical protein